MTLRDTDKHFISIPFTLVLSEDLLHWKGAERESPRSMATPPFISRLNVKSTLIGCLHCWLGVAIQSEQQCTLNSNEIDDYYDPRVNQLRVRLKNE